MKIRTLFRKAALMVATVAILVMLPPAVAAEDQEAALGRWEGNWGNISWGDLCDVSNEYDFNNDDLQINVNGYRDGNSTFVFYILVNNRSDYPITFSEGITITGGVWDDSALNLQMDTLLPHTFRTLPIGRSFSSLEVDFHLKPNIDATSISNRDCGFLALEVDSSSAPSAVGHRYAVLGGATGDLGQPISAEYDPMAGGLYRAYQGGAIYWHRRVGPTAYSVHGAIKNTFDRVLLSQTGYPTYEELPGPNGGRYQTFEVRDIYWHPNVGAFSVKGAIKFNLNSHGGVSEYGYPTEEEASAANDGRMQRFQQRTIYWHPNVGAFSVKGAIRTKLDKMGLNAIAEVGYPTMEEAVGVDRGRYQVFQQRTFYWHPDVGTYTVKGAIRARLDNIQYGVGEVGYPTSEEIAALNGGVVQYFQVRRFYWHSDAGAHTLKGAIKATFDEIGGLSRIGYPTSEETPWGSGVRQAFQKGWIYWNWASGAWVEYPCTSGSVC